LLSKLVPKDRPRCLGRCNCSPSSLAHNLYPFIRAEITPK
jgi:hypothetical protein